MLWCDAEKRLAGERLYAWIKKYKKDPFIQTIVTQDVAVNYILKNINESKSLQADIALLDLKELVVAIDETTQQIDLHLKYRTDEKKSRDKKGRVNRDAAYNDLRILANHLASKISLMQGDVEESVHYILLGDLDFQLKAIRKAFRIRTAKDKTRKEKKALKKLKAANEKEVKQLKTAKQVEMKHPEIVEQSQQTKQPDTLVRVQQTKPLSEVLLETIKTPSTNGQLTDKPSGSSAQTTARRDLN